MNKVTITLNGRQVAIECETGSEVAVSLTGDGFKFAFSKIEKASPVVSETVPKREAEEARVIIMNPGAHRIETIKAIRVATQHGLGEAKSLMEKGTPFTIFGADRIKEFRRECSRYNIDARISEVL